MASYTFTGDVARTYPTYRDVTDPERPKTLDAEPGGTYAIEPAAGHVIPDENGELQPRDVPVPPDDGLWKAQAKRNEKKGED